MKAGRKLIVVAGVWGAVVGLAALVAGLNSGAPYVSVGYEYYVMFAGMIFLGTMIVVMGFFTLHRNAEFAPRNSRRYKLISCLIVAGACVPLLFVLLSPSPAQRSQAVDRVRNVVRGDVVQVEIKPHPNRTSSLTMVPVKIRDPGDIDRIVAALHTAREFSPEHPGGDWYAVISLKTMTSDTQFVVMSTGQKWNGTIISLDSQVTEGWHIGDLRCDDLGPLLESLIRPAKTSPLSAPATTSTGSAL